MLDQGQNGGLTEIVPQRLFYQLVKEMKSVQHGTPGQRMPLRRTWNSWISMIQNMS